MSWNEAEKTWSDVIQELDSEKFRLRCSMSGAWYRGVSNSTYSLLPALFRSTGKDHDWETSEKRELNTLNQKIAKKAKGIESQKKIIQELKKKLSETGQNKENSQLFEGYADLNQKRNTLISINSNMDSLESKRKSLGLLRRSEAESFHDYYFRSGENYSSSWEVLAEMQHTGVPTRLLDWTETPLNAFYFAVEPYIRALAYYWRQQNFSDGRREYPFISKSNLCKYVEKEILCCKTGKVAAELSQALTGMNSTPRVWVMNAIECSLRGTDRYRIWDVTQNSELDYYKSFISHRDWQFKKPIPIYSPWRRPRIAAQRGMFTIHGWLTKPLDSVYPVDKRKASGVLGYIDLEGNTPIYVAKKMLTFYGMDHYSMFRDLDSLAEKINIQFF